MSATPHSSDCDCLVCLTDMTQPREQASASVTVKCVICGHKEMVPLTREMPMCSKCFGPVTAEKVTGKAVRL